MEGTDDPVTSAFSASWGRVVATLIRWCGDWELAEEAAQDAFATAAADWPRSGVPERPLAWLLTVARNRARDQLRRRSADAAKVALLSVTEQFAVPDEVAVESDEIPDDRLRLIFTCCHPALAAEAQIALTLRTLCGLSNAEIGRAFLVTEPTMAKRLVRARARIKGAGIPYQEPSKDQLPGRLAGVLAVLYLLFNEGYAASAGASLTRVDLTAEAIRLARLLHDLLPGQSEATALLALMLLTDARRPARTRDGKIVPLREQDRSAWNQAIISEGLSLLDAMHDISGPYAVQARIAAAHATAASAEDTDWATIASLYELLPATPVVELNRAVAVSMVAGAAEAMPIAAALEDRLSEYHLFWATRADFDLRVGDRASARDHLKRALDLAPTTPERRLLRERLEALE